MENSFVVRNYLAKILAALFIVILMTCGAFAQDFARSFEIGTKTSVSVINRFGKISVKSVPNAETNDAEDRENRLELNVKGASESDLLIKSDKGEWRVEAVPKNLRKRIDITVEISFAARVSIEAADGETDISGAFEEVSAQSSTGTIYADVPTDFLKYDFVWTQSRPRFLSAVELAEVEEKRGGRFNISGKLEAEKNSSSEAAEKADTAEETEKTADSDAPQKKHKSKKRPPKPVKLNFTTARGVILLGVSPSRVPSDLRERPLTEAAKAIVRSGNSVLSEAVHRVSPKYFGDYAQTLPFRRGAPNLKTDERRNSSNAAPSNWKRLLVSVTDKNGRAVSDLKPEDFSVAYGAEKAEIVHLGMSDAPFNLVILLDVSASVEEKIDFIRKAARNFVNVSDKRDRLSIVTFREDVQKLAAFSTDKNALSKSLDTFDAGGGTALYDALGYVLTDTLRPLRGERTAIVILSDGDDNRSFLTFDALQGAIEESGALIYPLYVPSELIPYNGANGEEAATDPLRSRYLGLTTKADAEGRRLAEISGGVYYPIKSSDEIQKSYEDVVKQLRTSYNLTIRAENLPANERETALPRLQVRVARPESFVRVIHVSDAEPLHNELREEQKEGADFAAEALRAVENGLEITGEIVKVSYKPRLNDALSEIKFDAFDINLAPPSFILTDGAQRFGVSKWVSPKRTRTYPYQRVYETLSEAKKAAIIPVLKDEGAQGERDFIQFDTISLMNLLGIHSVLTYYEAADKAFEKDKITNQRLSAADVSAKLKQLENFRGTAFEWNLRQLDEISATVEQAKKSYAEISAKTGVPMHSPRGLETFVKKIKAETGAFREFSRRKSRLAQSREFVTIQPNESLESDTKGRVTITDAGGGQYFFTCDETLTDGETLYLIEDKHSRRGKMPAAAEIKDGLLKMMLYANLQSVKIGGKSVKSVPVLRLTGEKTIGKISSRSAESDLQKFLSENRFTKPQRRLINELFAEANENGFVVRIEAAR